MTTVSKGLKIKWTVVNPDKQTFERWKKEALYAESCKTR